MDVPTLAPLPDLRSLDAPQRMGLGLPQPETMSDRTERIASDRHVRRHGPVRQWITAPNGWRIATFADGTAMAFAQDVTGRWYRAPGKGTK